MLIYYWSDKTVMQKSSVHSSLSYYYFIMLLVGNYYQYLSILKTPWFSSWNKPVLKTTVGSSVVPCKLNPHFIACFWNFKKSTNCPTLPSLPKEKI